MIEIDRTIALATDLTIAWLKNPNTRADPSEAPAFLTSAYQALVDLLPAQAPSLEAPGDQLEETFTPAVSVRKSLASRDRIISMIDGKPYMSLVRHLKVHDLTPAQYRARYGLKADYPMVAPSYSEARRAMALKIGLGGKAAAARAVVAAARAAAADKGSTEAASRKKARATRK